MSDAAAEVHFNEEDPHRAYFPCGAMTRAAPGHWRAPLSSVKFEELTCARCKDFVTTTPIRSPPTIGDAKVDHPPHYGGADNPYEAIKVIEAWGLGFNLGNALKYIARAEKKGESLQDLKKAAWYLDREIKKLEAEVTHAANN